MKLLIIESDQGLLDQLTGVAEALLVPMMESGHTPRMVEQADRILSPTRVCREHIRREYGFDSEILPVPIDTEAIPYSPRQGKPRVIVHSAGKLGQNGRKGTDTAIKIFQASGVARDGAQLIIKAWVDAPIDLAHLIGLAPDGISWINRYEPCQWDVYRGADLLIHTAKAEGYGLPIPEAMAHGLPVLAAGYAPITEFGVPDHRLIPVAGQEPSRINPRASYHILDVEAGAARLRALCGQDCGDASARGREEIYLNFSWGALREEREEVCA